MVKSSGKSSGKSSSRSTRSSLRSVEKYVEDNNMVILLVLLVVVVALLCMRKNGAEGFAASKLDHDANTEMVIVFFKMERCGHCKNFKPTWDKVSKELNNKKVNGKTCKMEVVDASNSALTDKYNVRGFPTVLKLEGEKVKEYSGDRSYADVVEFVKNK